MRYFIGCLTLLFIFAGCSTTETIEQVEPDDEPAETETAAPAWYDAGIHSSADSLAIHGYALSSSMDSTRAVELSSQTALEHLRFEIDRIAENLRTELVNSGEGTIDYSSPSFIIRLRNTVSSLSLGSATRQYTHDISDTEVHYVYTRISVLRTELPDLISSGIQSEQFINQIGTHTQ